MSYCYVIRRHCQKCCNLVPTSKDLFCYEAFYLSLISTASRFEIEYLWLNRIWFICFRVIYKFGPVGVGRLSQLTGSIQGAWCSKLHLISFIIHLRYYFYLRSNKTFCLVRIVAQHHVLEGQRYEICPWDILSNFNPL